MEQEATTGPPEQSPHRQRALLATIVLAAMLSLCGLQAAGALGSTLPTDLGEGFPFSVNSSDHVLLGHVTGTEQEISGPWSIWAAGAKTTLEPLNGGPETNGGSIGHELALFRLNDAGDAAGTSTVSYFEGGKELATHVAAWYSAAGVGHEVPQLEEAMLDNERAGSGGAGLDGAGDVAGTCAVQDGERVVARGCFSAGGTAHPSEVGSSDGPWTVVYEINEAGEMLGEVAEVNANYEPINAKYVLWKSPSATATVLNFTEELGLALADDGSILGRRSGKSYLRTPDGTETEISGMNPFVVNSSHVVIGSESVGGAEHAATWVKGTVTDLNSLLPEHSGWLLTRATAINDNGDIAGIGTHEGHEAAFLLQLGEPVASIGGSPSVALPETGTATEEFQVTLNHASNEVVKVGYATADGTATSANDDYTATSGTVTFPAGQTSESVQVQVDGGDGHDESAQESYKVELDAGTTQGATVAPTAATATGTVGLPGIAGKLVTGPASGAAMPLSPAGSISVQIVGKSSSGQAVSQMVTSNAAGAYTASVDPGTYDVTPTGVPAGQPSGFKWAPSAECPGKRKGATCEAVPVKAANGKVVQSTVSFGYGQRDPKVENIEVLQAAQLKKWDKPSTEIGIPGVGMVSSDEYTGVGFASKSPTIVRVYASNNGPGSAEGVSAQLKGYEVSSSGLTPLAGGALTPLDGTLDALPEPVVEGEHGDATATFNFQLPESWEHGKIVLLATVDPEHLFPECAGCLANNNLALSNVSFTDVPVLKFIPMSLDWTEFTVTRMPVNPIEAVTRTWPYWPLPTNGLEATGPPIHVDITAALASVATQLRALPKYKRARLSYNTASLNACLSWLVSAKLDWDCVNLVEGKIFAAEKAALGTSTATDLVVGVYNDTGLSYGVLGVANKVGGQFSFVPASAGRAEIVVHEMMHELGFKHSGCTGPTDEEPWPANSEGQASLVGFGENRSLNSVGGIGPILTTTGPRAGEGTHDIMSYCFPDWPSTFNWDRVLQRLANGAEPKPFSSYPVYSEPTATSASAGTARRRAMLTVQAIDVDGTPVINEITPGAQAEAGAVKTPFTAVARDAHGHVIARVPIRAEDVHADAFGPDAGPVHQLTMQFELPASGTAAVQITQGKKVLSTATAPRGRLRLKVRVPSRAICRRKGALTLAYRVSPAGALYSSMRVLALVGHRWKTIEVGAQATKIVLPAGTVPKGTKKLRVEYGDGFRSVSRTLKLPAGCRAS